MKKRITILLTLCVIILSFLPIMVTTVTAQDGGTTERVSVASDGTQGNDWSTWSTISSDGRYVVFTSKADNLVENDNNSQNDIFVRDRQTAKPLVFQSPPTVRRGMIGLATTAHLSPRVGGM